MNDEKLTKVCKVCGNELPIEEFNKHGRTKDGYANLCKKCTTLGRNGQIDDCALHGNPNSPLGGFTPRELIDELHARGYRGKLVYYIKKELEV